MSIDVMRRHFLEAIDKVAPAVVAELKERTFPAFENLFVYLPLGFTRASPGDYHYPVLGDGRRSKMTRFASIRWHGNDDDGLYSDRRVRYAREFENEPANSERAAFRSALNDWASKWHLNEPWVLDAALNTLLRWLQYPLDWPLIFVTAGDHWVTAEEDAKIPRFVLDDRWDPFETWHAFQSRVRKRLSEYRVGSELYRKEIGFDPKIISDTLYHYEWLALYQCKSKSVGEIAR